MIKITLNNIEYQSFKHYAEQSLIKKSHRGRLTALLVEEQDLYEKIKSGLEEITISYTQVRLLINWFLESTQYGKYLKFEDNIALKKLVSITKKYYETQKKEYSAPDNTVHDNIDFIKSILGGQQKSALYDYKEQEKPPEKPVKIKWYDSKGIRIILGIVILILIILSVVFILQRKQDIEQPKSYFDKNKVITDKKVKIDLKKLNLILNF